MENKKLNEQELEQVTGGGVIPDQSWEILNARPHGGVDGNGVILVCAESPDPEAGNAVGGSAMDKYELIVD